MTVLTVRPCSCLPTPPPGPAPALRPLPGLQARQQHHVYQLQQHHRQHQHHDQAAQSEALQTPEPEHRGEGGRGWGRVAGVGWDGRRVTSVWGGARRAWRGGTLVSCLPVPGGFGSLHEVRAWAGVGRGAFRSSSVRR